MKIGIICRFRTIKIAVFCNFYKLRTFQQRIRYLLLPFTMNPIFLLVCLDFNQKIQNMRALLNYTVSIVISMCIYARTCNLIWISSCNDPWTHSAACRFNEQKIKHTMVCMPVILKFPHAIVCLVHDKIFQIVDVEGIVIFFKLNIKQVTSHVWFC